MGDGVTGVFFDDVPAFLPHPPIRRMAAGTAVHVTLPRSCLRASWRCTGRAAGDAVATAFDENGFTYGLLYARELDRAEHSRRLAHHWAPKAATV